MVSWNNLPSEIIRSICSHLSNYSDLINCQRTCVRWNDPVQRLIYSNIRLKSSSQAILYIRTCVGGLGKLATKICLSSIFASEENEYELDLLTCFAELCPNVTEIEATQVSGAFWVRLKQECINGRFKFLESIPMPSVDKDIESYEWVADRLHAKLTTFLLCDQISGLSYMPLRNNAFWNFAGRLGEFPRLNKLYIIKKRTHHNIISFDNIILPSLTSLNFSANLPDISVQKEIQENSTAIDLSLIEPRPNIERVVASNYLFFYSDGTINYFMHKFPQLKTLVLNRDVNTWYDDRIQQDSEDLSTEAITKFLDYIFKIPSYEVHNVFTNSTLPILADFICERGYSGILSVEYFRVEPQDYHYGVDISICNTFNHQHARECDRDYIFYQLPIPMINISYFMYDYEHILDNPRYSFSVVDLIKTRNSIQHFSIVDDYYKPDDYDEIDQANLKNYLNLILSNCKTLKSISIECPTLSRFESDMRLIISKSMEYLKIYSSKVDEGFLTDISTRLPLLKHVCLSRCTFFDIHSTEVLSNRSIKIEVPQASLETISFICRQKQANMSDPLTKIYLKVETEASGVQYFFGDFVHGTVSGSLEHYCDGLENDKNCSISIDVRCKNIRLFYVRYNENTPQTFLINP